MIKWIIALVAAALALSAGVAFAATQLASESLTQVCVNNVNGLMRAASECRDGEHAATIGGGGGAQVTQRDSFTVPAGQTTAGMTLPLTGITVSGRCEGPDTYGQVLASALVEAASGKTMDAFNTAEIVSSGTVGGTSWLIRPLGVSSATYQGPGGVTLIASSNGATATVSVGAAATVSPASCKFVMQAVEAAS